MDGALLSTFRFLHAADIHLDSPLRGLERYDDAPVDAVRSAPRAAFENLVQLAIDLEVAFVLLAGDLYDGDWKDYNTGLFFIRQMKRLEEAGIPVHLVSGNHDAASQITRELSLPANVVHYSSGSPQTTVVSEYDVAIHGQSFKDRSVPDDLSAAYPQAQAGRFEIGLLHTSLDGRPGHANYSPCSVAGLTSKGYAYWALGHVHEREIVARDPAWIVFPGNIQGRHAREVGSKGCSVVTVEAGQVTAVDHHALDVVRWARIEVDLCAAANGGEALDAATEVFHVEVSRSEGRLLAARVVLTGATAAHEDLVKDRDRWEHELRLIAGTLGHAGGLWLEKIEFKTRRPHDLAGELERTDALGDLLRFVTELDDAPLELAKLGESLGDLKKKLPPILRSGEEAIDPTDVGQLRAKLPEVRELLLSRLLATTGTEA